MTVSLVGSTVRLHGGSPLRLRTFNFSLEGFARLSGRRYQVSKKEKVGALKAARSLLMPSQAMAPPKSWPLLLVALWLDWTCWAVPPRVARVARQAGVSGVQDVNLYGSALQSCSREGEPPSGWSRSGACSWETSDLGFHQVCVQMSETFLQSSAKYDRNDLSKVVQEGGHWCICAWAWASAVSRDPSQYEGLQLDCERTNGHLRDVYRTYAEQQQQMRSPSGARYEAKAALEAVEKLCPA